MSSKDTMDSSTEDAGIEDSAVLTKYKDAATIANNVIAQLVKECTPGKKIIDLCIIGDKLITDALSKSYTNKKIEKGIAFPTSIAINEVAGNFSPLLGDATELKDGDVAKIDLGVQIDGYISLIAHTTVVTDASSTTSPQAVTGRKADVICAAHLAADIAHRLLVPGNKNTQVTQAIAKVAEQFKVNPVEGVLSHQMKRYILDGTQTIINKETLEHKVEEFEFKNYEVYTIDIVMSTGDGKLKEKETRTTIYKRAVDQTYQLKMQTSRQVLHEINTRFPTLPFPLRALDEKKGKLGIVECLKHELVYPYPVLYEKSGEFIAQYKFTVLITPSQTHRLNSHQVPYVSSEFKITDPQLIAIQAIDPKRNNKKVKKVAETQNKDNVDSMDTSK